jgi:hypothetical protein
MFCALTLGDVYHDSYGVNGLFDKDRTLKLLGITDCIYFFLLSFVFLWTYSKNTDGVLDFEGQLI